MKFWTQILVFSLIFSNFLVLSVKSVPQNFEKSSQKPGLESSQNLIKERFQNLKNLPVFQDPNTTITEKLDTQKFMKKYGWFSVPNYANAVIVKQGLSELRLENSQKLESHSSEAQNYVLRHKICNQNKCLFGLCLKPMCYDYFVAPKGYAWSLLNFGPGGLDNWAYRQRFESATFSFAQSPHRKM